MVKGDGNAIGTARPGAVPGCLRRGTPFERAVASSNAEFAGTSLRGRDEVSSNAFHASPVSQATLSAGAEP